MIRERGEEGGGGGALDLLLGIFLISTDSEVACRNDAGSVTKIRPTHSSADIPPSHIII